MEYSGQDSWLCKLMYFKNEASLMLLGDLYEVRKKPLMWSQHPSVRP